jgi:hypothetical protein
VDEGPDPVATADDRDLSTDHPIEHGSALSESLTRAVETTVSEGEALDSRYAGGDRLEMEDGIEGLLDFRRRARVDGVLFGLDRTTPLFVGPAGEALGDESPSTGLDGRRQQVICGFGAEAVCLGKALRETPQVEITAQRCHLMDDHVRSGLEHGTSDGGAVMAVHDYRNCAAQTQTVSL